MGVDFLGSEEQGDCWVGLLGVRAMEFWGVHPKTSRAVGLENTASHIVLRAVQEGTEVQKQQSEGQSGNYCPQGTGILGAAMWVCEPGMRLHRGRYVTWNGGSCTVNKLDQ